ncbi:MULTISPECIES: UDP-glucose 4-epimerase GalE [Methanobacterium]|uniref:UDP-glucose 4-epimerase n=2 Tax=Methanobacterium formicicum TaxID=2162 RepID=A0A090I679_METFO|nr:MULTISPECIES: UDP-glucose 4-epimerase GalE [Methanobacterium]KUK72272.1 MAG: UDP-glucose 4-epimerase [Methanobacterium sp. 42_16]MDH2660032.1 UDP-glucose 4-epimerase GalE [Methanobacterium formicicum]CEA12527.1 UDP-glucose 4-epimerase [Methanobacterium formicicum]
MILVTGGAGYIGSHANKELTRTGYETVVLDNMSYGHPDFLKWGVFEEVDLGDLESIRNVFRKYEIEAVMHFAAFTYVGESVEDPQKYYLNNLRNTLNLLQVMNEFEVRKLVFSSTCATYGNPQKIPLTEDHPQNPINPYGQGKLMVEKVLKDYSSAYGLRYVSLRYFNAAGADPEGEVGERHEPETHLIPLILDAAMGKREDIKIFGTDYPTTDGTCIRDYIHVTDLADAHIKALKYLEDGGESEVFNLGNGNGFSVREVIEEARKVTGKEIKATETERRPGDPPVLVGSSEKARKILKWQPKYDDLTKIISTAWEWHKKDN